MPRDMTLSRVNTIAIAHQAVDGVDVRVARHDGDLDETLILTCPWPESLYAFESTWSALSEQASLIAVDLPGFGGSVRRDELLTPQTMGAFLVRLMDQWEIESPHLFAPDVGTSAALFAAARTPGRMRSLIVGSGAVSAPLQIAGALKDLVEAPDLGPIAALDPRDNRRQLIGAPRELRAVARGARGLPLVLPGRSLRGVLPLRPQLWHRAPDPR